MSRAKSTVRYASQVTGVNFEKALVWGAIAAAAYFVVWPALKGALAVKAGVDAAITTSRDALSSGLYRLFGPEEKFGPDLTYSVRFPDGVGHGIPSNAVRSDMTFVNKNLTPAYAGDGRVYKLVKDVATNRFFAFPV